MRVAHHRRMAVPASRPIGAPALCARLQRPRRAINGNCGLGLRKYSCHGVSSISLGHQANKVGRSRMADLVTSTDWPAKKPYNTVSADLIAWTPAIRANDRFAHGRQILGEFRGFSPLPYCYRPPLSAGRRRLGRLLSATVGPTEPDSRNGRALGPR